MSWVPTSQEFKLSLSAAKVMLVASWNSCGIITASFNQKGRTVTVRYYSEVILKQKKIKENLKMLCPRLAPKNVNLLHNDALSHTALSTVELIETFNWQRLSHPPYSQDLAH